MYNITSCLPRSLIASILRGTENARLSKTLAPAAIIVKGTAFDLHV